MNFERDFFFDQDLTFHDPDDIFKMKVTGCIFKRSGLYFYRALLFTLEVGFYKY